MELSLAAVQMSMSDDVGDNVAKAEHFVRDAASRGARIVLIPELFEGPYFCKDQLAEHLSRAMPLNENPTIERFQSIAAELDVVVPVSVYERAGNVLFNTVVVVDADGSRLGSYRKSHIPDGPGYSEKFYFSPGDTGFKVWDTRHGRIGVGICWDQWFPEAARAMALAGADCVLYPTAIGSEPQDPAWDSAAHWRRTMQGHAAANLMPVAAANRIGHETGASNDITFYGTSFIADHTGEVVADLGRETEGVITAVFDLDAIRALRRSWGLFRDRRPDLYGSLLTLDGEHRHPGSPT